MSTILDVYEGFGNQDVLVFICYEDLIAEI